MKKTAKLFIIFLTITLLMTGCSSSENLNNQNLKRYSKTTIDTGFNTFLNITGFCNDEEEFENYYSMAVSDFKTYNMLFDIYHNYDNLNNIKTINDNAGIQPVEVHKDLIELLELAREFSELSDNTYNVTTGAVLKIWHEYREAGVLYNQDGEYGPAPSIEELEAAAVYTGWDYVEIDDETNTVYLTDENASLDVGSIAKGFAAEKVATRLEESGLEYGVVNAGGNNRIINGKPSGEPYTVGITNPDSNSPAIMTLYSPDESASFVTSGDYQNFYVGENDIIYHHIIDPDTLFPSDYFHSVTIICKDSGVADALSTTLFAMDYHSGNELIKKYNELHPDNEIGVVWVADPDQEINSPNKKTVQDYQVIYTGNLKDLIKD